MEISNKYLLRYNNIDLSFANDFYVAYWIGYGFDNSISTTSYSASDGSHVNGHHSSDRQIIITLKAFNERQKQAIYRMFMDRQKGTLTYLPDNDESRALQIDCEVKSKQPAQSQFPMNILVTLICPYPHWRSVTESSALISGETNKWTFPWLFPSKKTFMFSEIKGGNSAIFDYGGTIATGFKTVINTTQALEYVKITNFYTGEYLLVNYSFPANSKIIISTETNAKHVKWRLANDDEYTDVTNDVVWGSTYFELVSGQNRVLLETSNGTSGIEATVNYTVKQGGA